MSRSRAIRLRCPICKKPVQSSTADFPFCSDRCRLIDLGKWASGDYVVSSPLTDGENRVSSDHSPERRPNGIEDEDSDR